MECVWKIQVFRDMLTKVATISIQHATDFYLQ